MVHVHMAFWVVGAPRIDKIEVPQKKEDEHEGKAWVEIDVVPEGVTVVPQSEAADRSIVQQPFWTVVSLNSM